MKYLLSLTVALSLLVFSGCSDVHDSDFITAPALEKNTDALNGNGSSDEVFPYNYLEGFKEINSFKYFSDNSENSLQILFGDLDSRVDHLYLIMDYKDDQVSNMLYLDNLQENSVSVEGYNESQLQNIKIYSHITNNEISENISFFNNEEKFGEIPVTGFKVDGNDVFVQANGLGNYSLKFAYAQIITKTESVLLFIERPASDLFVIPNHGNMKIEDIKLYGYYKYAYDVVNK